MRKHSRNLQCRAASRIAGFVLGASCALACDGGLLSPRAVESSSSREGTSADDVAAAGSPQPVVRGLPLAEMLAPYPHGLWRLAPREDLFSVRIWASHILIRHSEATLRGVVFGPLETADVPPSERTRADARALAESIAAEAQGAPEQFAALARQRSEDLVTQTTGGSLGAVQGLALLHFPQVLDALAALRPGEVSRAVETDYGFHVFQLRPRPPEAVVSASHVIIGHDDAPWLAEHLARGAVPRRSRSEALALATSIYERARAAPQEFPELVSKYSEHFDAEHGGDFGTWSTRQPGPYSRELELLIELPEHGIAAPIDTLYGIEITQRTPARPRERYAMALIQLPFDPEAAATEPQSKPAMFALATGIARELASDPGRFESIQSQYCCSGESMQWTTRQEPSRVAYAVERLALGEVGAHPIELGSSFAIPRRIDPALAPPEVPLQFELPAPGEVDLDTAASRTSREQMAGLLAAIAEQVERELALDAARATQIKLASELPPEFSDDGSSRQKQAAFRALLERVRVPLGAAGYARYLEIGRAHLRAWILERPM